MITTIDHDSILGQDSPAWLSDRFQKLFALGALVAVVASCGSNVHAASSQPKSASNVQVDIFITADETATRIETVSGGAALTPMAEVMGAGGVKWYMVKTPAGNVGWIKTGDNSAARQVDGHFRSLPKESMSIGPARSPEGSTKTSVQGPITIPVKCAAVTSLLPSLLTSP